MSKIYISQPRPTYTALLNFKYYFMCFKFSDLFNPRCYPVYLVKTYFYSPITTAQKQYCSTMFFLLWAYACLGCDEAADHMITKMQRTSPSLFLCHIHGIV